MNGKELPAHHQDQASLRDGLRQALTQLRRQTRRGRRRPNPAARRVYSAWLTPFQHTIMIVIRTCPGHVHQSVARRARHVGTIWASTVAGIHCRVRREARHCQGETPELDAFFYCMRCPIKRPFDDMVLGVSRSKCLGERGLNLALRGAVAPPPAPAYNGFIENPPADRGPIVTLPQVIGEDCHASRASRRTRSFRRLRLLPVDGPAGLHDHGGAFGPGGATGLFGLSSALAADTPPAADPSRGSACCSFGPRTAHAWGWPGWPSTQRWQAGFAKTMTDAAEKFGVNWTSSPSRSPTRPRWKS